MGIVRGRPMKVRKIGLIPRTLHFSPRGRPGRPDEVELSLDQWEALRVADWLGFSQLGGAKMMGISRASFGRILRLARKNVADALVHGKMIRIKEGNIQFEESRRPQVKIKILSHRGK